MAEDEGLDLVCQTVMYKKKRTDRVSCPSVYSIPLRSIIKIQFSENKKTFSRSKERNSSAENRHLKSLAGTLLCDNWPSLVS